MDLDLPTRRRTLLLGGTGALAAAFLAACGDDSSPEANNGTTTTAPPAANPATDLSLSTTMASLEVTAIDTYQAVLDAGHITDLESLEVAKLFQQHHQGHLDSVNEDVTGGGGEAVTERNEPVYEALIQAKLAAATTADAAAALLSELEVALSETYTWSAGTEGFTTPDLRQKSVTIAGVDARHVAVLQIVGMGAAPASIFPPKGFYNATNAIEGIDGAMDEG